MLERYTRCDMFSTNSTLQAGRTTVEDVTHYRLSYTVRGVLPSANTRVTWPYMVCQTVSQCCVCGDLYTTTTTTSRSQLTATVL
jgi:hypothetical protein